MRKIKRAQEQKGFTLIEVLIYMAIVGVVISNFISFSISATNTRNKTYVIQEVQANARIAKELVGRKIKEAVDVVSPAQGAQAAILELDMPGTSDNTVFSLSNGVLYQQIGAQAPLAVTNQETLISTILFSNNSVSSDLDSVAYSFTMDFRNVGSNFFDYSETLNGAANVRQ